MGLESRLACQMGRWFPGAQHAVKRHVCKQAIILVWVNIGLAVCEDIPMLVLTLVYINNLSQKPDAAMLISMVMSGGMVCMHCISVQFHSCKSLQAFLKCGKLLLVKGLLDTKKDLDERLLRNTR